MNAPHTLRVTLPAPYDSPALERERAAAALEHLALAVWTAARTLNLEPLDAYAWHGQGGVGTPALPWRQGVGFIFPRALAPAERATLERAALTALPRGAHPELVTWWHPSGPRALTA